MYGEEEPREPTPLGVWIFWLIVATALFLWAGSSLLKDSQDKYVIIQTFVLTLTLIFVAWYAVLTRSMQQSMVRQTNLSVLPLFIVHIGEVATPIRGTNRMLDELELENVGNGVALNVHIVSIGVDVGFQAPSTGIIEPNITFETVVSIDKKAKVLVPHSSWLDKVRTDETNSTAYMDWLWHLTPVRATKDYEMKIRFMDILGNKYMQMIHVGKSGIWADVVKSDEGEHLFSPHSINHNPFKDSPLKYLRQRRRRIERQ